MWKPATVGNLRGRWELWVARKENEREKRKRKNELRQFRKEGP